MAISALTLENIWKVYYYVAIFSTILFVLKMILFSIVGGDSEVFADFNTEIDTDCSFNFLSSQSIMAFFMGFGWMGYAGLRQFALGQLRNFLIAFAVGLIFMFVTAGLMFAVKKLEKNVKKDKKTAIGKLGKAYTNFDENSGKGKVEVEISGQLVVTDAINMADVPIKSFDIVEVVGIEKDLLQVVKNIKE